MRGRVAVVVLLVAACAAWAIAQAPRTGSKKLTRGEGVIDAAVCADCHASIAETYSRTAMSQAFGIVKADTPREEFPEGTFRHELSEQSFRMFWRDGKPFLRRALDGPDGAESEVYETEVHYWIGSGTHGRSYIHRNAAGKLLILPLSWYPSEGGHWDMNPNYDRPIHSGFARVLDYRCLSCHVGNPELEEGADLIKTGWRYPGKLVEGVDCQKCHGPGQAHVEAARAGQSVEALRKAIVNPSRLTPERQMDVCLQCHLETTSSPLPGHMVKLERGVFSYKPGEPLTDWSLNFDYPAESEHHERFDFVSAAYRLRQSPCFIESKGAMTCTTCHDPHDVRRDEETTQKYSNICLGCHQTALTTLVAEQKHPAATECITCHMPERRASDAPQIRVSDHRIPRFPLPEAPLETELEAYKGEVVPYYPAGPPATADLELHTAVAQVTQDANVEAGAALLDELVRRYNPAEGSYYLALGEAWRKTGRLDKGGPWLEQALRRMPNDWRPQYSMASALASIGRFDPAAQLLRSAASLAPDEPGPQIELASVLMLQGRLDEANAAARAAVALDPSYAESQNALGAVLLEAGDAESAIGPLREAVRLRPELPPLRTDLAVVLALTGRQDEAKHHFERALRLNPAFAEGHAAYAGALLTAGSLNEAREHYETALRLDPSQTEARRNLAAALVQLGQPEAATEQLQEVVRLQPENYDAHFALGQLLLGAGRGNEARAHLQKAAESTDTEIRNAAQGALRTLAP